MNIKNYGKAVQLAHYCRYFCVLYEYQELCSTNWSYCKL